MHNPRGMVGVDSQQPELLLGCFGNYSRVLQRRLRTHFCVFRDLEGTLGVCAVFEQKLCAVELNLRQSFVIDCQCFILDGLAVIRIRARYIRAPHFEQQLPFGHLIAKPGINFHDSSRGERGYRHLPRDVRTDHSRHVQLGRRRMLPRCRQRKLVGMIHFEIVNIQIRFDGGLNRPDVRVHAVFGRDFSFARHAQNSQRQTETG